MKQRLIVIGGGAAGFFCAVNAAAKSPGLEVTIIEKTGKILSKVRVSGGGRCNVTHACFSIAEMVKKYPRGEKFLKHAFHQFFTKDTIDWFQERNVALKTEADGRMFPESNSSETIVNCLLQEANTYGVQLFLNREVVKIGIPAQENSGFHGTETGAKKFRLFCKDQSILEADFVCVACGGFNKPVMYNWLSHLGHHFEPPVPSLFTFNVPGNPIVELMGISMEDVIVKVDGTPLSQQGPLLITHWGFSGPAVLKLSAFAAKILALMQYQFSVSINWLGSYNENSLLAKLKTTRQELAPQKIIRRNPFNIPQRLWQYHVELCNINESLRWADLPAKQQNLLAKQLTGQQFQVMGKTTFRDEFVTAGGIVLQEVTPGTMMSRIVPDLFFAGEIMDVDGITGGFNFQHAWTSGYLAAAEVSRRANGLSKEQG
jgi:predicted Rossmann fold flavoprotein